MVGTGDKQDPDRSLDVEFLIETFKLIPSLAIVGGCPFIGWVRAFDFIPDMAVFAG